MQRVGSAVVGPLQVELLGEEHRGGVVDEGLHRLGEPRVEAPRLQLGAEVGERLDAVEGIGVALPLEHHLVEHGGLERVAAHREPAAALARDEPGHQRLAGLDHGRHLVGPEHALAHDEAVDVPALPLARGELVHQVPPVEPPATTSPISSCVVVCSYGRRAMSAVAAATSTGGTACGSVQYTYDVQE